MTKQTSVLKIFIFSFSAFILLYQSLPADSYEKDILVKKIHEKMESFEKFDSWKAFVVSKQTKMNRNWEPKEITEIQKNVKVNNGQRTEEIKLVTETKRGKSKDITEKYKEKAAKEKDDNNNKRSLEISTDEIFPFDEEKRKNYEFSLLKDSTINDIPVFVLEAHPKSEAENLWEGKYYIDKDNYHIIKVDLTPSIKHKLIKEFSMQLDFQVFDNKYHMIKSSRVKIDGGIFIKHFRMITEEEYFDFKVIE